VRFAVHWWCIKTGQQLPTDESELWYIKLRSAMLQLTSDVFNAEGLNVVHLATVVGAVPLLDELLNQPLVYRFQQHGNVVYDITYLTPQTSPESSPSSSRRRISRKNKVEDAPPSSAGEKSTVDHQSTFVNDSSTTVGERPRTTKSCLDLIVEMNDEILAARILDVSPFRQLVQNYWKTYQWLYGTLMLVHIIYMIVYTAHVLPDSTTIVQVYNTSRTQSCLSLPTAGVFGLFLIWPCLVLAFLVYYIASSVVRYYVHGFYPRSKMSICPSVCLSRSDIMSKRLNVSSEFLFTTPTLLFSQNYKMCLKFPRNHRRWGVKYWWDIKIRDFRQINRCIDNSNSNLQSICSSLDGLLLIRNLPSLTKLCGILPVFSIWTTL